MNKRISDEDMMIIRGEDNGGYDYKLQFCSLEGYECQFKKEQAEQLKNEIITNDKLIHHIMNCPTCIELGLNDCNDLAELKGVYEKIPFNLERKMK